MVVSTVGKKRVVVSARMTASKTKHCTLIDPRVDLQAILLRDKFLVLMPWGVPGARYYYRVYGATRGNAGLQNAKLVLPVKRYKKPL